MSDNKRINEFTELVNGIDDTEVLGAAKGLMDDLAIIANMKERIEMLEAGLASEERAVFFFFTLGLDDDEVGICADAVTGRLRFLTEKEERANLGKGPEEGAEVEEESEEENP